MDCCSNCGEPLVDDALCAVCLLAGGLENSDALPDMIGRYRIIRLIGEGGMGVVYEAEQEQPRRTVALKVIRSGLVSPEVLRRFTQESQALGRLHHPGIAQVYEAGTANNDFGSQPFFVMELIRGQSLDSYAEAHGLNTRARLQLMLRICDAVQHAHERGIIHRDLKPGNILVDESGHPKILDFGVARMTDSDIKATRQTDVGQLVGTLAYMSPEQVLADPPELDSRSDVYTLGVILYELLAGRLPYKITRQVHQAVQAIREDDPVPLSSVNRLYRGDIETIVGKAVEKDKSRRYASAADLAADIRNYLEDQPIAARPPSATYQLNKFARRHRTLVAGIAAVFVALIVGIFASTIEASRARLAEHSATSQRDRAMMAEARAEAARTEAEAAKTQAETAKTQAETAKTQAETAKTQALAAEAKTRTERDRALREKRRADTETATAQAVNEFLRKDVLAQASNRGQAGPDTKPDPDLKIRTALDRAAARIEGKFNEQPQVEASIRQTIGNSYLDLGLFQPAQRQLERSLELRTQSPGASAAETAITRKILAHVLSDQGKYAQAEQLLAEALAVERRVLGKDHPETLITTTDLALAYRLLGKYPQSEQLYTEVLEVQRRKLGAEDPDTLRTLAGIAILYDKEGKHRQSAQILAGVLENARRVFGEEHPDTVATMNNLANAYMGLEDYGAAERLYLNVHEIQLRIRGEEHPNTLLTLANLATVYRGEKKYAQSEDTYRKLLESAPRVFGKQHPRTLAFMEHLATLYRMEGKLEDAEALYTKVTDGRRQVLGPRHPDTVKVLGELGLVRLDLKRFSEAEPVIRESLAARDQGQPGSPARLYDRAMLGASMAGQGKYAEAEPLLISAYDGLREQEGAGPVASRIGLQKTGDWIVQLYRSWPKPEKVIEWKQRLSNYQLSDASK